MQRFEALQVFRASSEDDFADARALSRAWVEWLFKAYPDHREATLRKFPPDVYEQTIADLPVIHSAPHGAILLCKFAGKTVGCVMYDQMEPGVAEVHRLFVTEEGRGNGVGRALLEEMFLQMRLDGYTAVRFSSARFLTHARQLYESLGFVDMPAPEDAPGHVYFMERSL